MSKIFGFYKDDVDYAWYQSSNIKFSKCIDNDNALKTLFVVFNNGSQYKYSNVDVNQYLLFREDDSQGKALNKYIKGNSYPYEKVENADIQTLEDELNFRVEGGYYIHLNGNGTVIEDSLGKTVYSNENKLDENATNAVIAILSSLGHETKILTD